jgi:hypothetical protein
VVAVVAHSVQWKGCGLDIRGIVWLPVGSKLIFISKASRPAVELTQLFIQWVPSAFPAGVKWPRLETGHWASSGKSTLDGRAWLYGVHWDGVTFRLVMPWCLCLDTTSSSETLLTNYQTMRCHNPEDHSLPTRHDKGTGFWGFSIFTKDRKWEEAGEKPHNNEWA